MTWWYNNIYWKVNKENIEKMLRDSIDGSVVIFGLQIQPRRYTMPPIGREKQFLMKSFFLVIVKQHRFVDILRLT